MPVNEETFRQVALEDPEGHWELYCGEPHRKPGMSIEHNYIMSELHVDLRVQLNRTQFDVRSNAGHVRRSAENYYIPDVFVIPVELQRSLWGTHELEWYAAPLPLVVEIWSPSTGAFDVETKLREYQRRGDLEIWRIHPYERTLTTWQRQPDGSYSETIYTGGVVHPVALPDVAIDLDRLFTYGS
jgi:Uma2 family endonuclease